MGVRDEFQGADRARMAKSLGGLLERTVRLDGRDPPAPAILLLRMGELDTAVRGFIAEHAMPEMVEVVRACLEDVTTPAQRAAVTAAYGSHEWLDSWVGQVSQHYAAASGVPDAAADVGLGLSSLYRCLEHLGVVGGPRDADGRLTMDIQAVTRGGADLLVPVTKAEDVRRARIAQLSSASPAHAAWELFALRKHVFDVAMFGILGKGSPMGQALHDAMAEVVVGRLKERFSGAVTDFPEWYHGREQAFLRPYREVPKEGNDDWYDDLAAAFGMIFAEHCGGGGRSELTELGVEEFLYAGSRSQDLCLAIAKRG